MHALTANHAAAFRAPRKPRFSPLRTIMTAIKVQRERNALMRMEDHELADIGLTREEAMREAARPIWDLPSNR